jgi:predicted metal-dependent enzyme (double-stranded beta helix superfamily)
MFDVDELVAACEAAIDDAEPRLAVREILARAVADPSAIAESLPPDRAELVPLHVSDRLTVLKVVWGPGMVLGPHDHRMWAAIAVYSGGEDNRFYRRTGHSLLDAGARSLRPRDVCLLGDDAVHEVRNPTTEHAGAIHVYGGDFFATPRSEWRGEPLMEEPFDVARTLARFDDANRALGI